MNKWLKSIITGLVMGGLAYLVSMKTFPSRNSQLYNVHYVLGSTKTLKTKKDLLGETPASIKERITEMGYRSVIANLGSNRVDILVDNVNDTLALREIILNNVERRKIEFRELYTLDELPLLFTVADRVSDKIFRAAKRKDASVYSIISPLVAEEVDGQNVLPAAIASLNKKDTAILNQILHDPSVIEALPAGVEFYFGPLMDEQKSRNMPDEVYLYAIKHSEGLKNEDIAAAESETTAVRIKFNSDGREKLADLTLNNLQRYLAVILDNAVIETPRIYSVNRSGLMTITLAFSLGDPELLAAQLTTNYLPDGFGIINDEISARPTHHGPNLWMTLLGTFIVSAGLALVVFNSLKNNKPRL